MTGRPNCAPVLIAAGGTGGHVIPALVVAQELLKRQIPVVWVGTRRGLEFSLIPAAGIPIEWLDVVGLRGKSLLDYFRGPYKLAKSILQSIRLLRKHKPRVVLGMGGFVAGPVGISAKLLGVPLVLHEQNAVPGLTNRCLARVAKRILQAFPGAFAKNSKVQTVGNPVRSSILLHRKEFDDQAGLKILVIGGSLGARYFNENMPKVMAQLGKDYCIWHQTGASNATAVLAAYREQGVLRPAKVEEFIEDMAAAYQWADLTICRSGAMTVSELAIASMPSILIPFPHAVDDHQTANGQFLLNAGAALLMQQKDASISSLVGAIRRLGDNRQLLKEMSCSAYGIAVMDAGITVTDVLLEVATR